MEYNILENGWYQLPFTVEADGNVYRDALVITPEEYNVLTLETFEDIKQQRYAGWKTIHEKMLQGELTNTNVPDMIPWRSEYQEKTSVADRYWVGGNGTWDGTNTANWSATSGGTGGASLPAVGDNIIFDANSGSGNYTVTFNGTWSGPTGNVTMSNPTGGVLTLSTNYEPLYITGNLTIASGVSFTAEGFVPYFENSAPVTVTTNGVYIENLTVNGDSTVTLGGALTVGTLVVMTGTFDSGNFNITTLIFNGGPALGYIRTVSFGSSTVTVTGGGASWVCQYGSADLTITSGTYTINFTFASTPYPVFNGGGKSYATVNVSGSGLVIAQNNTFGTLANTVSPTIVTFTSGTTQTVTNFNLSGTFGNLVTINSKTAGTAATLSKSSGTVSCDYLSIKDSIATGGATWNAYNSTNVSNNTGWTFSEAPTSATTGNFFRMF
jgi:hypothetical protein